MGNKLRGGGDIKVTHTGVLLIYLCIISMGNLALIYKIKDNTTFHKKVYLIFSVEVILYNFWDLQNVAKF